MIGKVVRGKEVHGLLYYLFRESEEHVDPHLVGAFDDHELLEPPRLPDGSRDIGPLGRWMNQFIKLTPPQIRPKAIVWHLSISAAPEDRTLTDAEWRQVCADMVVRTGLAPADDPHGCRWAAVRHADNHVHLVVVLARGDGRRAHPDSDYHRVGEVCRDAEIRHGLRRTRPPNRTVGPQTTRAEREKAARRGQKEPVRVRLARTVRAAAVSAHDRDSFAAALERDGLLVRWRHSDRDPGEITGYAVAWPDDLTGDGQPVWYGGSRLGADLSLPKLARRWTPPADGDVAEGRRIVDPAARRQTVADAARAARVAAGHIHTAATDPAAAGTGEPAAHAAGDLAGAAAHLFGGGGPGVLDGAARRLVQAGAAPYGRTPHADGTADLLRGQARLLRALGRIGGQRNDAAELLLALAELAEAIARLRRAQQALDAARDAQAAGDALRQHTAALSPPRPRTAAVRASTVAAPSQDARSTLADPTPPTRPHR
ncbi:hypothetical protein E0F15_07205 [Frankia sp. B2]|uniref:relaxase/mobilization nuclease domain-containing protein n=1 Tax=Frankia TaxID=1854 RepID=UPI0003CF9F17|nr:MULTISPECIES: relaxase/mobilization nuclease domain-containing protein [Frankia]ETA03443.1 hypothetical protein CcI6DRAFT_01159 [Frankia sp. CcI6]OAA26792.1 relaxase/mobilization nuclease [Frankia casuarinae]OHV56285.1 hypothetical protein CgIS1_09215 [Frankia sp. CgIS1]TFE32864.1 hypothetical protein E0F15_07205 [Frankia sp. B2]